MQKIPKVAIITRTRNRNRLLSRAIESVLGQSMTDWHHVIVNDGGNKSELEKLCASKEEVYGGRLTILHLDHVGMQSASNEAIAKSKSTYLVIHDDDDTWHKDFLEETTSFLDELGAKSKYQGVIGKTLRILEEEQDDGSFKEIERSPYVPLDNISMDRIGYQNPFPPIAFLYRRSVHKQIGEFNPDWDLVADMDFNFRFLQEFEVGVINKELAHYHWRTDGTSSDNANTVTTSKQKHATLYNELKNHYLRQAGTIEGSTRAITFLLSAFGVENQWMTSEVRERTIVCQDKISGILAEIEQLKSFNDESVWPKLEELEGIVRQADSANSQLEEVRQFNNDTVWPKLQTIAEKGQTSLEQLESLNKVIDSRFGQLDALNQALTSRLQLLDAIDLALGKQSDRLEAVEKVIDKHSGHLESIDQAMSTHSDQLTAIDQATNRNSDQVETVRRLSEEKFDLLDASNKDLSSQLTNIQLEQKLALEKLSGEQQTQAATVSALQSELTKLREHQGKHWKIGRLKLTWMDGTRENDPEDTSS